MLPVSSSRGRSGPTRALFWTDDGLQRRRAAAALVAGAAHEPASSLWSSRCSSTSACGPSASSSSSSSLQRDFLPSTLGTATARRSSTSASSSARSAFFLLLFLLFLRFVPFIPVAEVKELKHELRPTTHAAAARSKADERERRSRRVPIDRLRDADGLLDRAPATLRERGYRRARRVHAVSRPRRRGAPSACGARASAGSCSRSALRGAAARVLPPVVLNATTTRSTSAAGRCTRARVHPHHLRDGRALAAALTSILGAARLRRACRACGTRSSRSPGFERATIDRFWLGVDTRDPGLRPRQDVQGAHRAGRAARRRFTRRRAGGGNATCAAGAGCSWSSGCDLVPPPEPRAHDRPEEGRALRDDAATSPTAAPCGRRRPARCRRRAWSGDPKLTHAAAAPTGRRYVDEIPCRSPAPLLERGRERFDIYCAALPRRPRRRRSRGRREHAAAPAAVAAPAAGARLSARGASSASSPRATASCRGTATCYTSRSAGRWSPT